MLRLARPSAGGDASSDLSFAESFTRKRKADRSCLMELGEGKKKSVKQMRNMKNDPTSHNSIPVPH